MTRSGREVLLDSIQWEELVRPGDLVVWGQASAEPVNLTTSLMTSRAAIGGFRAFVGISHTSSVSPRHLDSVAFTSYCGTGSNRDLSEFLDIVPIHYRQIADTLAPAAPIVLLSLAPGCDDNHFSYGAAGDYIGDVISRARLVVAEVNDQLPRTGTGSALCRDEVDLFIRSSSSPPAPESVQLGTAERSIARHIAGLVVNGATLQVGLGGIPAAALRALSDHRDLGIHSGLIGDEVAALAEAGVITNARKSIDRNLTVAGLLAGGPELMRWANNNPSLAVRTTRYTHDPSVLASINSFVAINSAIEVDLTGQVNAETANGRYVGAVGGAGAFLRGAMESHGGLPIIALPSTAGTRSRIVAKLSGPVSTSRADAGLFITEHGIADLRGLGLRERRKRMLDIADPEHQGALEEAL